MNAQSPRTQTQHRASCGPSRPQSAIVVGIDGSPASSAALRWAVELARPSCSSLCLIHAWQLSAAGSAAVAAGAVEYRAAMMADARARATRWVMDTLGGTAAAVRWVLEVHEGAPGPVLVSRSEGARLLVVGTPDHTGLRRAFGGSVSHYAVAHSTIPVVAVPPAEPETVEGGHGGRPERAVAR